LKLRHNIGWATSHVGKHTIVHHHFKAKSEIKSIALSPSTRSPSTVPRTTLRAWMTLSSKRRLKWQFQTCLLTKLRGRMASMLNTRPLVGKSSKWISWWLCIASPIFGLLNYIGSTPRTSPCSRKGWGGRHL
jgi:hypothetical protein